MVRKLKGAKASSGAGNQANLLKQAQEMQQQMLLVQEELKNKELTASVGGGAVAVKVNGQKEVLEIKITDDIIKEAAEDKEMLEDLIISAIKEAMRQADELSENEMGKITGGIHIPGLF